MTIYWHGLGCFVIKAKQATVYINPTEKNFRWSAFKGDIVISTETEQEEFFKEKLEDKETFVICRPGEYEVKEVFVHGIPVYSDKKMTNIIYKVETENIRLAYLGNLSKKLDDQIIEELNGVDILIVPVGGESVLDAKNAAVITNEIEPKIVIPCYFKTSDDVKSKLATADKFCKETGFKVENVNNLKIRDKELSFEETKIVILDKI